MTLPVVDRVAELLGADAGFRHRGTALWERDDGTFAALSQPISLEGVSIPADLGRLAGGGRAAVVIHVDGSQDAAPGELDDGDVRLFIPGEHASPLEGTGEDVYDVVAIDRPEEQVVVSRVRVSYRPGHVDCAHEALEERWRGELIDAVLPLLFALTDSA